MAVDLNGLVLATPVMVASGCAGTGRELGGQVDTKRIGALVSRSVTVHPRKGDTTPRVAESPAGVIWSTGLQNPGIDAFVAEELPRLARNGSAVIVSIAGGSLEEFVRMTSALQGRSEVAAIEVRLSEPDHELGREVLGAHQDRAGEIVGAVARMSLTPVFAKIPALVPEPVEIARTVARAGAHGITLVDSAPAIGVDASRLRPALGPVTGWLSGPAMKPIAMRAVFDVARALPELPIVASGGIRSGDDAIEMMLAGAWAVQVGTATLVDPLAPVEIARGIAAYLRDKGIATPAGVRGRLRVPEASPNEARA